MFEAFLANTSAEGLRPLGTPPQRSYELITGTVRDKFSARHAALFAEPVTTEHGDRFDWYATSAGKPVLLSEMEDQAPARAVLDALVTDIRGMADGLLASKDAGDQRLGEALANALEIPDEGAVYILQHTDGEAEVLQPVLVNWAWVKDEQSVVRGVLTGTDARVKSVQPGYVAPPPPVAAAAATVGAGPIGAGAAATGVSAIWWWLVWLGWALLALMIAYLVYLLIEPCGLRVSWLPDNCPRAQEQPISPADERKLLEDKIVQVEKQIAIADRACQPDIAALPIPEPPVTGDALPNQPILPEVDERARAAGAERGDLTFTIIWDGADDLDLLVTCPTSEQLFFMKKANCNGVFDVDSNSQDIVPNPIENAYFSNPVPGNYRAQVHLFKKRDTGTAREFTLQIRDGDKVFTQRGSVSAQKPNWQFNYQYEGK